MKYGAKQKPLFPYYDTSIKLKNSINNVLQKMESKNELKKNDII